MFLDLNVSGVFGGADIGLADRVVFLDDNGDGVPDPGEPDDHHRRERLLPSSSASRPGPHRVHLVLETGDVLTGPAAAPERIPPERASDPSGPVEYSVALGSGQTLAGLNFGLRENSPLFPLAVSADLYDAPNPDANTAYIKGAYGALFDRVPAPSEVAGWQVDLAGGLSRQAMAQGFFSSAEQLSKLVVRYYAIFLDRTPSDAEVQNWVQNMQNGMSEADIVAGFISSAEYLARAGGTDDGLIRAIYRDVLSRDASDSEVASWEQRLAQGLSVQDMAAEVYVLHREPDPAGRVVAMYSSFAREADPAGLQGWITKLQQRNTTWGAVAADFLGSEEFYERGQETVGG